MTTKTPASWIVWRLADDKQTYGENAGKVIIVAQNGEHEICSVVYDEAHANLMAAAPQLLAALEALHRQVTKSEGAFSWPNVYARMVIEKARGSK